MAIAIGSASGYNVSNKKLGMWLFIASDAATFAAVLAAYAFLRTTSPAWPAPFHSIAAPAAMTVLLLSSSLTMASATRAAGKGKKRPAIYFMGLTILCGLGFLMLHFNEWRELIQQGVRLHDNPWEAPLFGATFFSLTGLHMAHVAIGLLYLSIIALRFAGARSTVDDLEVSALYWYFVDVVWMFLFPTIYLW
jgi:cytochrome c oxidase subunit III